MVVPWLALRGLRSSRTFVLLVLAVALGAGFQISNTSTLAGFESGLLDDALVHGAGDVRVWPRGPRFEHAAAEVAELVRLAGDDAGVIEAVPALIYGGAVAGADQRFVGATVWGVDPAAQHPPFRLVGGEPLRSGNGVLIGTALAVRLDVKLGDAVEIRVILGVKDQLLGESNQVSLRGKVTGIVSGTGGSYRAVFVSRSVLADAVGRPGTASTIAIHLADHGKATEVAARITGARTSDGGTVEARAWDDDDPGWSSYLGARRAIGGISYAMVIAAIAVPMWALLYIHVLRKRRELAILAALGFSRRELFAISVLQSVLVAVIGCVIGAGLGYALSRYFTANPLFEWESLVVRPVLSVENVLLPSLILIGTSIIAALHPAARAARIEPAAVLRRIE